MPATFDAISARAEQAGDESFLFELYTSARTEEVACGSPHELRADCLKTQFQASLAYQTTFPNADCQIVLVDGEKAGRLVVHRTADELLILDIALMPEYRNAGIGRALLRRVFGEAAATHKPVHATVFKSNHALRFFERLAFVKIGETNLCLEMEWRAPAPVPAVKAVADTLKLPMHFEPAQLQEDLAGILAGEYVPHFNTAYFEGDWSAVPLRSVGGIANRIYPDPTAKTQFADTALLARCPYFRQVLAALPCPQQAVRLLRLKAGSIIKEHRDHELGFEDGEVRLHIPVITNPAVEFVLNQVRVIMNEGECWYLNVNLPHRVANRGTADRIHLVVDCVVNDWLREVLLTANRSAVLTS